MAVLDEGGYEVVCRDTTRGKHEVTTPAGVNDMTHDLTIWMTARHQPERRTSQATDFLNAA